MDESERHNRLCDIIVHGIPEQNNENIHKQLNLYLIFFFSFSKLNKEYITTIESSSSTILYSLEEVHAVKIPMGE